jgi:hypothetical protein
MVRVLAGKIFVRVSQSKDWSLEVKYLLMQMVNSLPKEVNLEKKSEVDRVIVCCSVIEVIALKDGKSCKKLQKAAGDVLVFDRLGALLGVTQRQNADILMVDSSTTLSSLLNFKTAILKTIAALTS